MSWFYEIEPDEPDTPLNRTTEDIEADRLLRIQLSQEIYDAKTPEQKLISHIANYYTEDRKAEFLAIRKAFNSEEISFEEALELLPRKLEDFLNE